MSCASWYTNCRNYSCREIGSINHTYARYRLQAIVHLSRGKDDCATERYGQLAQALDIFRRHLSTQDAPFAIARARLAEPGLFGCIALNPIFADRPSILFSEATLALLRACSYPSNSWRSVFSERHPLASRTTWFWLRNLACFLGDVGLFDFYCSQKADVTTAAELQKELPELLGACALHGHEKLSEYILQLMSSPKGTDLKLALRGASRSGNLPIASMVLQACPPLEMGPLCSEGLCDYGLRKLPIGYADVAKLIVNGFDRASAAKLSTMLRNQAELGAVSVVRLLLKQHQNYRLSPYPTNLRGYRSATLTALWAACVNTDVECVRTLIQEGFFARTGKDDARELCLRCIEAAVQANSFVIVRELCNFMEIGTESLCLQYLAGVDGATESMAQRLRSHPDELNRPSKRQGDTAAERALGRAALLLRVENAKFLLGRGVRLRGTGTFEPLRVEYRRKRTYEQKYHEMQKLLQDHGLEQMEVDL